MYTVNISKGLKRRFCKNANIPINIFEEPYFFDRIKLYDKYYDTVRKYNLFLESLKKYDNEQDFFEDYNKTKDAAINFIKNSSGYKSFNEENMSRFVTVYRDLNSNSIFKEPNIGRKFVSVDMRSANFSSLLHYDETIFDSCKNWTDFLSKFTDNPHFLESKYMRQVILGNCNPSRHITYEKYLMSFVLSDLLIFFNFDDIVSFSHDEIIFDVTKYDNLIILKRLNSIEDMNFLVPVKCQFFRLENIPRNDNSSYGYIKVFDDGTKELKCIENEFLPIIIRKLEGKEIEESDLYFIFKDELAKLITVPESLKNWKGIQNEMGTN